MQYGLKSMASIRKADGLPMYTMEYADDYRLDDFLKVGANSDAEVRSFIAEKLLSGRPLDFTLPKLGCSTFAARLKDGSRVFGRNFDEDPCPCMRLVTRPENGYASVSMVNLAYIGYRDGLLPEKDEDRVLALAAPYAPIDGVNEKGLTAGMLFIATKPTNQNTGKPGITTSTAIRMILDRCETVEEALEMIARYDMHSSAQACFHIHIADARGGSVVVEYVNDEMKLVQEEAATNFLFNPLPDVREIGRDRYEKLKARLAENGGVFEDMNDAMSLLQAVSQDGRTRWSSVYHLTQPKLLLAVERDFETLYSFDLEK